MVIILKIMYKKLIKTNKKQQIIVRFTIINKKNLIKNATSIIIRLSSSITPNWKSKQINNKIWKIM